MPLVSSGLLFCDLKNELSPNLDPALALTNLSSEIPPVNSQIRHNPIQNMLSASLTLKSVHYINSRCLTKQYSNPVLNDTLGIRQPAARTGAVTETLEQRRLLEHSDQDRHCKDDGRLMDVTL